MVLIVLIMYKVFLMKLAICNTIKDFLTFRSGTKFPFFAIFYRHIEAFQILEKESFFVIDGTAD
jgi:hypothetical protein